MGSGASVSSNNQIKEVKEDNSNKNNNENEAQVITDKIKVVDTNKKSSLSNEKIYFFLGHFKRSVKCVDISTSGNVAVVRFDSNESIVNLFDILLNTIERFYV
jgi:hypothetical protein